jgi:hypothetical protein
MLSGARWAAVLVAAAACAPAPTVAPPTDVDPTPRARWADPVPGPCEPNPFEMIAHGVAYTPAGLIVPGVAVGRAVPPWELPEILARTDARGAFEVAVPSGTRLAFVDRHAAPASWCQALPFPIAFKDEAAKKGARMHMRANNALVAQNCPIRVRINPAPPDGAHAELLIADGDGVRRAGRAVLGAALDIPAPCDASWALIGEAGWVRMGASGALFHAARDGEGRLAPTRQVTVRLTGGDALAGVSVWSAVGERRTDAAGAVTLTLPTGPASLTLRGPGLAGERVTLAEGDDIWELQPAPGRAVEVRCAGGVGAICPAIPSVRHPDGALTRCARDPDHRVWCDLPVSDGVVGFAGRWTSVPEGAAVGWIDLRGLGHELKAQLPGACTATATRRVDTLSARWSALRDEPRWSAASAACTEDGLLRLGPLSPGAWTVEIDPAGGPPVRREIEVVDADVPIGKIGF